jgi:A/G-specific adenine glycosylase
LSNSQSFSADVIRWQAEHGRHDLPWQRDRDPYRVWLSEIMLQQTQVSTVLAYFDRFLLRFPNVLVLAASSVDDVLALWSGLGYYSRARNLHRCAQTVATEWGGEFPKSAEQLAQLPGIGRSTAAAIAAFCFNERVAILDGNVKRVLGRVLAFSGDLAQAAQERILWAQATELLPQQGIAPYTQGLMDLGATLCLIRQPQCPRCPVQRHCQARLDGEPTRYPIKTRKLKRSVREHHWLWVAHGDRLWLTQRPATGIWAGLWSLPEFSDANELNQILASWPGQSEVLPSFVHVLTHLDWTLHPVRHTLPTRLAASTLSKVMQQLPSGQWFTREQALALGVSAPLKKWLHSAP